MLPSSTIRRCLLIGSLFVGCSADGPGPVQTAAPKSNSTWDIIQTEIFAGQCVSCHTAGTSFGRQSGLVLTPDVAYEQLVGATPTNAAAAADGLMRVSDLGQGMPGLLKSYLWEKINAPDQQHFYGDHLYYGEIMPLGDKPLTNGQLAFIRAWIEAGAPETGHVADPDLLQDESRYEVPEFQPLAKPENGVQLHLPPFEIQPNTEREIFVVHPLNNEEDIFLERVQISMKSGSHHFILYTFQDDIPPERMPEPYEYRDLHNGTGQYVLSTILTQFYHLPITGSQWPFVDVSLPPGVAVRLPKNTLLDLNSHYINPTSQPVTGEVYTNLHFADPSEVEHEARFFCFEQSRYFPAGWRGDDPRAGFYLLRANPHCATTLARSSTHGRISGRNDWGSARRRAYLHRLRLGTPADPAIRFPPRPRARRGLQVRGDL